MILELSGGPGTFMGFYLVSFAVKEGRYGEHYEGGDCDAVEGDESK